MFSDDTNQGRRSRGPTIKRAVTSVLVAGTLTGGALAFSGTAMAESPEFQVRAASAGPVALAPTGEAVGFAIVPAWCPLGTHGGKGGGCRGGGINNNKRLNDALRDTAQMYKDAGECAVVGVVTGTAEGDPMMGSWIPAAECGSDKPQGRF